MILMEMKFAEKRCDKNEGRLQLVNFQSHGIALIRSFNENGVPLRHYNLKYAPNISMQDLFFALMRHLDKIGNLFEEFFYRP